MLTVINLAVLNRVAKIKINALNNIYKSVKAESLVNPWSSRLSKKKTFIAWVHLLNKIQHYKKYNGIVLIQFNIHC